MQDYIGTNSTGDDDLLSLLDTDVNLEDQNDMNDADLIDLLEEDVSSTVQPDNSLQEMDLVDLLDYEYETQEQAFDNSSFLSFEYDYANDDSGITVMHEVDPLADQDIFDHEQDEDAIQDLEIIKELQDKLVSLGYKHVELYDYEQLEKLMEQEESLYSDDMYNSIKGSFVEAFNSVIASVMSSKATLLKVNNTNRMSTHDMPAVNPALGEYFTKLVWRDLELLVAANQDRPDLESYITINVVINRLNKTLPPEQKIFLDSADLYQYLLVAIPAAINSVKSAKIAMQEDEMQKTKVINYILRDEAKAIKAIENSSGKFIKQVFRRGDNYTYYCAACNKEVRLPNKIISYVLYAAEREDSNASIMPHLIVCPECGQEHLLAFTQYLSIRNALSSIYKPSAGELFKFLCKVSTGTAVTKINPSIQDIASGMELVCDLGLDESFTESTISKKKTSTLSTIYPDFEYDKAIEDFYNKLLTFGDVINKPAIALDDDFLLESLDDIEMPNISSVDKNHLSYKEAALCITSELSMSYQATKNRALYSLIMFLNEYEYLRSILDRTSLWDLQNKLVILKKVETVNTNDKELIAAYKQLASDEIQKEIVNLEELKDAMLEYRKKVVYEIEELNKSYEDLLSFIARNIDLFAHTKILNINQISFKEVAKYLNSSRLAGLIDELTDRMIINNYSEKFADTLFKSSILRGLKIKPCLLNMADGAKLQGSILHTLEQKQINVPAPIVDRFKYVTANHLSGIKEASKALKNYEYYNFIEALSRVEDPTTLISLDADKQLKQAINLAKKKWETLEKVDYIRFYLKDFSEEEIADIDPSYRTELAHMVFGKYVPKRQNGESLSQYIERYNHLDENGLLSTVEAYNYSENFEEFKDYFIAIIAGSNVLDLNSDNFAIANFVRSWMFLVTNHFRRDYGIGSLGYQEQYFNRLSALNTYAFKEASFSFVDNTYRVLNGIYFDASEEFVNMYVDSYDSCMLNERSDLNSLTVITAEQILHDLEIMDVAEIHNLETKYQNSKRSDVGETSTDEIIISKEDILNSMEAFMEVD